MKKIKGHSSWEVHQLNTNRDFYIIFPSNSFSRSLWKLSSSFSLKFSSHAAVMSTILPVKHGCSDVVTRLGSFETFANCCQ
jgi:hypothetical protein